MNPTDDRMATALRGLISQRLSTWQRPCPPFPCELPEVLRDLARGDHVGRFPAYVAKILIHLGQNGFPGPPSGMASAILSTNFSVPIYHPRPSTSCASLAARTG